MPWKREFIVMVLAAVACPPAWGDPVDVSNPPQGTFADEWLVVEFGGAKVGHANQTMTREGDHIISRLTMSMTLGRAGQQIKISTSESSTETIDGRPIEFTTIQDMGFQSLIQRGRISDGRVSLFGTQAGVESKREFPYPAGAMMAWGMYRKQMEMGFAAGTRYDVQAYVPSQSVDSAMKGTFEVIGPEEVQINGTKLPSIKILQTMTIPLAGTLTMTAWMNADGNLIQSEVPMAGLGGIRMIRTDRETALKISDPPEFFMQTLVTVPQDIDRSAKSIRYRLSLKDTKATFPDLPATGLQSPGQVEGNQVELVVMRQDHEALRAAPTEPTPPPMEQFLASNALMNLEDPELRKMADQAAGDETRPYQLADKLRIYVTEAISSKSLNVGFGTATEVCRTREGDCSEHAVLLAALGRIKGLPSRVVTGLVYVPQFKGTNRIFGFHMWTQFYIQGQWVDFDAAQRESDCNPTHIAINVSSLNSGSLVEAAFALMNILGQLKIDVLEVRTASGNGRSVVGVHVPVHASGHHGFTPAWRTAS